MQAILHHTADPNVYSTSALAPVGRPVVPRILGFSCTSFYLTNSQHLTRTPRVTNHPILEKKRKFGSTFPGEPQKHNGNFIKFESRGARRSEMENSKNSFKFAAIENLFCVTFTDLRRSLNAGRLFACRRAGLYTIQLVLTTPCGWSRETCKNVTAARRGQTAVRARWLRASMSAERRRQTRQI
jgi:hypothetical protein